MQISLQICIFCAIMQVNNQRRAIYFMSTIKVDFSIQTGKVKPMHAVNNGPVYKFAVDQRITNIDYFISAGIPYARNHDAAFFSTYGGEHTVDVHNIFKNFDADPYDPASYWFAATDEYIKVCEHAGVRTFYRLGSKIEHGVQKFGTLPPKDFKKWAIICEHIIRHYTEGWANGFHYDIEYWEIWNEPDLSEDESDHKPCWGGTKTEFFELYKTAATHLKKCFPHLKIGGPAVANRKGWSEDFLASLDGAPLDFFSWHRYAYNPRKIEALIRKYRELLDSNGFTETESILNEWNYVKGWTGDAWLYSLKTEKSLKGASFITSVMCIGQREDVDMLMYYDARPCGMNGMFSTDFVCERLKGYYPFYMFGQLYKLDSAVLTEMDDENLYAVAAKSDTEAAVMFTRYNDEDIPNDTVKVDFCGFGDNGTEVEVFILNEEHDLNTCFKATYYGEKFSVELSVPNYTSYLIKMKNL